ncbi:MAG: hypothetical protein Tsb009_39070 [Planctomycetaceae bacterium]
MAGPWFAVQKSNASWKKLDTIWLSNNGKNTIGRVELRVELEGVRNELVQN